MTHEAALPSLLWRQVRIEHLVFWRNRPNVFFTFFFPILILLLLAAAGSVSGSVTDYRKIVVPGVAAMAIAATTFHGLAIMIAYHRDQGVLKQLIASPLPISALLAAKLITALTTVAVQLVVVIGIGKIGFGIHLPQHWLPFLGFSLLGTAAFAGMGIALANMMASADSAPALANAVYLPLVFVSGVFFDLDKASTWVRSIALALPLAHLVDPLRASYLGHPLHHPWLHAIVLCAWGVAGTWLAVRKFRWEPSR